jgi:hypothetical protein
LEKSTTEVRAGSPTRAGFARGGAGILPCAPEIDLKSKLLIALIAYGVLGVLAWQTLDDKNIRIVTLALLGFLTLKTILHDWRMRATAEND